MWYQKRCGLTSLPWKDGKHVYTAIISKSPSSRVLSLCEIRISLISSGIESNPGPVNDNDNYNLNEPMEILDFEFLTINCNGLTNDVRLLQAIGRIKKHIKNRNAIIFLQETHNANIILLENIWEGKVHISSGTGGSRGVITLSTKNFNIKSFKSDTEGRYLFTTIELGNSHLLYTANIYSPNNHDESKVFITETLRDWDHFCLHQNDQTHSHSSYVIAGDLNCVLSETDSQNRNRTASEKRLSEVILTNMEERDMYDSALRSSNGNNFTWNRGDIFSKIDHIFLSVDLLESTKAYNTIWDLVKSDHAAINIKVRRKDINRRGFSYPKLYLSDLRINGATELIKAEINKAIEEFPSHWNPHQKLDFIKLVIRTNILELRAKHKSSNFLVDALRAALNQFSSFPSLDSDQTEQFNSIRAKLSREEDILSDKLRIMAGVKWIEEGERSTKFFLNSINSTRAASTLDYLNTDNGPVHHIKDILQHAKDFYNNLYTNQTPTNVDGFYDNCPLLSVNAQNDLDKPLTMSDLRTALKSCTDSTPGLDGIPYSYYKIFSNQLLPLIMDSWNYSLSTKTLPQSQSTSVISLIPKVGKDKHDIKNWRPISISSCDLKIITKSLSIKVGKFLNEIICESQMGYVPGRDINFNNRLLRTAMNFCNSNDLDYICMSLDAQKAYDSLDHNYITNTLKNYGFPKNFIDMVDVLHRNNNAQVQVNGFLSERFSIKRGVKQGDALSCALFIIAIDPLLRNLEQNRLIDHLNVTTNCQIKTIAYADDIAIVTRNTDESINCCFQEYSKLTKMSGLTLNADKTEILNLSSSAKVNTTSIYNNIELNLTHKNAIVICGNYLSLDQQASYEHNVTNKIKKLNNQLNKWRGRNLSINGRMIIVKTFAISQLIFTTQFQTILVKDLKRIEHLCYSFVWNGPDRVKRSVLKAGRQEGGTPRRWY